MSSVSKNAHLPAGERGEEGHFNECQEKSSLSSMETDRREGGREGREGRSGVPVTAQHLTRPEFASDTLDADG